MARTSNVFLPHGSSRYCYKFMYQGRTYRGPTGKTDRRDAEQFVRAEKERVKKEVLLAVPQNGRDMTISTAFSKYLEDLTRRTSEYNREVREAELCFRRIVKTLGPNTLMSALTFDMMSRAVTERQKEPKTNFQTGVVTAWNPRTGAFEAVKLSGATINKTWRFARRAYLMARDVWEVPVKPIKWGKLLVKESGPRTREVKLDEEETIRSLPDWRDGYRDCFSFAIMSGLRISNFTTLRWSEVDLINRQITVTQKGDKTHSIEIDTEMMELLLRQVGNHPIYVFTFVAQRAYRNLKAGKTFIRGNRYPVTKAGFTSWFKRIASKLNLNIRVQDLRRTAGSRMLRETGNLRAVQVLLGHAEPTTTAKHYAHIGTGGMIPLQEQTSAATKRKRNELAASKAKSIQPRQTP